jgi:hypothetical protein
MNSRHSFITLCVFGPVAVALLLAPGCGRIYGPEFHTGLDNAPVGEDYSEVKGLPVCEGGWVRLPPSSDKADRDHDFYTFQEVHALVYGDADWSGTPAKVYPVVYRTFAQDEHPVGWTVYGSVEYTTASWIVHYAPFNGWDESTQSFTLACAA